MGGETESNISGWTVDTLRESIRHVIDERDRRYGERFDAQEKAVNTALIAQEKAVTAALIAAKEAVLKAESASEKRFEAVNEFRGQLSDQARELMPRLETEQRLQTVNKQLSDLTDRMNLAAGALGEGNRQSESQQRLNLALPAIIFGAIGTLLGIVGFIYALAK